MTTPKRLQKGSELGAYRLDSLLGAGGMGEVYRAKDVRLDRWVAIKVLLPRISVDLDARRRFDREARVVASLNHPNICTLHDIGSEAGVDYIVMEYLPKVSVARHASHGESLRESTAMCHNVHMKTISIRELHLKTGRWVRHAASRGPIVVTDRGRRVAALQPFDASVTGRPLPNREAAIRKRSKVPVDSAVYVSELREGR